MGGAAASPDHSCDCSPEKASRTARHGPSGVQGVCLAGQFDSTFYSTDPRSPLYGDVEVNHVAVSQYVGTSAAILKTQIRHVLSCNHGKKHLGLKPTMDPLIPHALCIHLLAARLKLAICAALLVVCRCAWVWKMSSVCQAIRGCVIFIPSCYSFCRLALHGNFMRVLILVAVRRIWHTPAWLPSLRTAQLLQRSSRRSISCCMCSPTARVKPCQKWNCPGLASGGLVPALEGGRSF